MQRCSHVAAVPTLYTKRLRLEPFDVRHIEGLSAMNSLPEVMRFVGGETESKDQTAAVVARAMRCWAAWGASWWAFVDLKSERVAGAGCIQYLRRDASQPVDLASLKGGPMEIGWRLHPDFWHQGLAIEAARRMTAFAFRSFALDELLSVRHPENLDSRRVMDRLGMRFRGLETWYGTTVATHVIARTEWRGAPTSVIGPAAS
jgi:RimJ/RimL family protein N-acetyltransferase